MQHDHILKKFNLNQVRGQGHGHSDHKMVHGTSPSQDASTYQIWDFYFNQNRRYALEMNILKMRSDQGHSDLKIVHNSVIPRCIHTPNLRFLPQIM